MLGLQIREDVDLPRIGVPLSTVVHQEGWYFYPCVLPLSLLLLVCVLFLFVYKRLRRETETEKEVADPIQVCKWDPSFPHLHVSPITVMEKFSDFVI